jgi:hypothetical protein
LIIKEAGRLVSRQADRQMYNQDSEQISKKASGKTLIIRQAGRLVSRQADRRVKSRRAGGQIDNKTSRHIT